MVGRGKRSTPANSVELIAASASARPRARMSLMSSPDTKAVSPPPVMIRTPTSGFCASVSSARRHSPTVSRSRAFFTLGRSIVSVAIDSEISTLVFIDSLADLAPEPPGLDVLREQRTRPVLLPQAPVQVFEDAEARVQADEVHELEGPHRVIQTELQRLVDI